MTAVVFLTPSFPPDFGRLGLLRESMQRFGVSEEHLILVDREHLDQARRRFAGPGVTVIDKAAICPGAARHLSRQPAAVARWLRTGWWQQQFAKLNAGRALGLDRWLCLDSDTFLLGPIAGRDFVAGDGRLSLIERTDADVGRHVAQANRRSARILRLDPAVAGTDRVWTGQCVPFHGQVVAELLEWLEAAYRLPWWVTMSLRGGTEYALYGLFARYVHELRLVQPVHDYLAVGIYEQLAVPAAAEVIVAERAQRQRRLAMVHSHLAYSQPELDTLARLVWNTPDNRQASYAATPASRTHPSPRTR